MESAIKTNDRGELYFSLPHRPFEITMKRRQADEARALAAQYRRWAEQEERIAAQADEIADAWQKDAER